MLGQEGAASGDASLPLKGTGAALHILETQVEVSSHLDRGTFMSWGLRSLCYSIAAPLCLQRVAFSFYSLPQTQNASNTGYRPAKIQTGLSWRKFPILLKVLFLQEPYTFFFFKYKNGGGRWRFFFFSFLVNVLCSVTAIKSSENTISFEKKKLKALLQTKLWKKGGLGGWKGPTMVRRKGFMLMRLMPFVSQASTSSLRAISGCTERLREPQSTPTPPFPAQRRIW